MGLVAVHCILLGMVPASFWAELKGMMVEHFDEKNKWDLILDQWVAFCETYCTLDTRYPELEACLSETRVAIFQEIREGSDLVDASGGTTFRGCWNSASDVKVDPLVVLFGADGGHAGASAPQRVLCFRAFLEGDFENLEVTLIEVQLRIRDFSIYYANSTAISTAKGVRERLGDAKVNAEKGLRLHASDTTLDRLGYPGSLAMREYFVDADVELSVGEEVKGVGRGRKTYRLTLPLAVFHYFFGSDVAVHTEMIKALIAADVTRKQAKLLQMREGEELQSMKMPGREGRMVDVPKRWAAFKCLFAQD
jgi:hypothetical protein